jgi:hypothetical protein
MIFFTTVCHWMKIRRFTQRPRTRRDGFSWLGSARQTRCAGSAPRCHWTAVA